MRIGLIASTLLLAACGSGDAGDEPNATAVEANAFVPVSTPQASLGGTAAPARWDLQTSGEGVALALVPARGGAAIRLFCPAAAGRILVNVPGFNAVGSEERLSFGSGREVVALVADARGDVQRGGVSGSGPVPKNLAAIVAGGPSASYGAQTSGPHAAPPSALVRDFVTACQGGAAGAAAMPAAKPKASQADADACMMQGDERLTVAPRRAIGTEPFWNARIEGRCVTYSHPEDQTGTRVWTRYAKSGAAESWTGTLAGKPFTLRIRPQQNCSDGMSDRSYPLAAELSVNGETRKGCALPS